MDVSKREGFPSVFRAIEREPGGVAIVLSPNFDARESLIEQVEEIVSDAAHPMRETCVEGAIANPARMVLSTIGSPLMRETRPIAPTSPLRSYRPHRDP